MASGTTGSMTNTNDPNRPNIADMIARAMGVGHVQPIGSVLNNQIGRQPTQLVMPGYLPGQSPTSTVTMTPQVVQKELPAPSRSQPPQTVPVRSKPSTNNRTSASRSQAAKTNPPVKTPAKQVANRQPAPVEQPANNVVAHSANAARSSAPATIGEDGGMDWQKLLAGLAAAGAATFGLSRLAGRGGTPGYRPGPGVGAGTGTALDTAGLSGEIIPPSHAMTVPPTSPRPGFDTTILLSDEPTVTMTPPPADGLPPSNTRLLNGPNGGGGVGKTFDQILDELAASTNTPSPANYPVRGAPPQLTTTRVAQNRGNFANNMRKESLPAAPQLTPVERFLQLLNNTPTFNTWGGT